MTRINKTIHTAIHERTGKRIIVGITVNGKTISRANKMFDSIHRETQHNGNMNAAVAARLALV